MGYGGFRPGGATTSKERQVARSPARSCGRMCSASHAGKPLNVFPALNGGVSMREI
jgi:hypothetical protein